MAVTDFNTGEWMNGDGLLVRFGTDKGRASRTGELSVRGGLHMVETSIDLVALSALSTFGSDIDVILSDNVTIPNGALIEKVDVIVTEVTAGTSATLDVGLYDQNRTTVIDQDGILSGATTTWHTGAIGTTVSYTTGVSGAGSSVGTVLTNTGILSAQVDGAAYTAGVVKLRIWFSIPTATELT